MGASLVQRLLMQGMMVLVMFGPMRWPSPATAQPALLEAGARLFFEETFNSNGRTCATCHRTERNFTLDPAFIATLPPTDPLLVAETTPALRDLEDMTLLRERGKKGDRFIFLLTTLFPVAATPVECAPAQG